MHWYAVGQWLLTVVFLILAIFLFCAGLAHAQVTVATGDSRTVTEPTFPAVCSTVAATKFIVQTTAVNIDPYNLPCGSTGGTLGTLGCTGGTSYEPSSSSGSYIAAETTDNTAVQTALNACTSGQAVELIPGGSGERAFVLAPWSLPTGVGIVIDAGIRVYASRNLSDYGGTNCGIVTSGSSSCNHWITAASTTGSGIYGYGVLDGRGWDAYIGQTTAGFYANRIQAYCNARGAASHGSPACTPTTGNNSFGPNAINLVGANNFTMYKITVKDSGNFLVNWTGNGFTAWGVKLLSPFEVSNTDGWDPLDATNGTFTHGFISNGDNHMAIKATSGAVSNITLSNTQTGAGIALAIGSATQNGVSNILVTDNVQNGNLYNDQSAGLQIASSGANGGLVDRVTFRNDCMVNEQNAVRIYTNYGGGSGANTPIYHNILLRNITVLPSTAPYTTGNSGTYTFQGLSGNPITAQIDNLAIQGVNQGVASQNGITTDQYASVFLGPGAVPSSITTQFAAGTSVTTSGSASASTPYTCTTSTWQPLIGELNLKTPASNNAQSYTNGGGTSYTLQAVLQPATDISTKESPALTQPLTFLDNGVSVGSVALAGDGTYAALAISSPTPGTHTYTANYPGDAHYPSFTFGRVAVTITPQVAWSISRTATSQTPTPFPIADRVCCGAQSNWTGVETARGTYVFTLVDSFISNIASHPGSFLIWTDRAVPAWASGGATTIAPTDLTVSAACQNVLSGTTTTDCFYKEYQTKFMQHVCGVSSQPASPLVGVCTIKVYEVWNEMNVGNYWTDTVGKLAQMADDKTAIIRLYCGDCTVIGGSVSAGGDGTGGSWINGSVGLEPFLAAWGALSSPHLPDAVSWHAYPSRTTIKPAPFPETLTAHGSGTCTGSSNSSCRTAIKDQISTLYGASILGNAAISAWAANLPAWQTEGLYGINSAMTDGIDDTDADTWLLRRAFTSRWMIAQSAHPSAGVPPVQSMYYSWQDQCWGTANGTNAVDGNCNPPDSNIPSGVTDNQVSFAQTKKWLDNTKYVGPLSSSAVAGGNVWTVRVIYRGYPAQLAWFDGWLTTTSFATPFSKSQTLLNANSAVNGSITLDQQPVLLTRPNAITFSIF